MSRKPTIIMVLLAVFLTAITYYVLQNNKSAPKTQTTPGLSPNSISLLKIEWSDGRHFSAVRSKNGNTSRWLQTEPVTYPLRTDTMNDLILALCSCSNIQYSEQPVNKTITAKPQAIIDTGTTRIELIRRTIAGRALVRIDGKVYTTDDQLFKLIADNDPVAWRSRKVFDNLNVDISRITLISHDGKIIKLARLRGKWHITEPIGCTADEKSISKILAAIIDARVQSFIADNPENLADFGLQYPTLLVFVELDKRTLGADGKVQTNTVSQTLAIGNTADVEGNLRYADRKDRNVIFTVTRSLLNTLAASVRNLADKHACAVNPTDIAAIKVTTSRSELKLKRKVEGWSYEGNTSSSGRSASDTATELINLLTQQIADDIILPEEEADTDNSESNKQLTVELLAYDGGPLAELLISATDDNKICVEDTTNHLVRTYPGSIQID